MWQYYARPNDLKMIRTSAGIESSRMKKLSLSHTHYHSHRLTDIGGPLTDKHGCLYAPLNLFKQIPGGMQ
jgi:hypothetical protein